MIFLPLSPGRMSKINWGSANSSVPSGRSLGELLLHSFWVASKYLKSGSEKQIFGISGGAVCTHSCHRTLSQDCLWSLALWRLLHYANEALEVTSVQ